MTFDEIFTQVLDLLQRQGRVLHWALKRRFDLDETYLEDLKVEIIQAQRLASDEEGAGLGWCDPTADTSGSPTRLKSMPRPPWHSRANRGSRSG
jgi:hypothetical protein